MNWLKRANHEILDLFSQTTAITDVRNIKNPDSTHQSTAITAERNLTSVLAVPNLNKSKISTFSNVSNGSGLTKKNQNFNVSCKEEKQQKIRDVQDPVYLMNLQDEKGNRRRTRISWNAEEETLIHWFLEAKNLPASSF